MFSEMPKALCVFALKANLRFQDWLPTDRIFLEEDERYSATLKTVHHVHALFQNNTCPHCQQNGTTAPGRPAQYYLV